MILVLKKDTRQEEMDNLITWLESQNVRTHISNGEYKTVVGLVGDTSALDIDLISGLDIVESVTRITEPFKKANRKFHPDDSIIQIADGVAMGGDHFQFIAGPCSVESPEQVMCIADAVKKSGAHLLRGGAFKPRTSPYDFQGLQARGHRTAARGQEAKPVCRSLPRSWTCQPPAAVRGRRRHSGRRAQHAELRAAQGAGPYRQADPAQARPCQHA